MSKSVVFVVVTSIMSVLLMVLTAFNYIANNNQRRQSCRAILVSLQASSDIARAGIRPIQPIPDGAPTGLRLAFEQQIEETRKENERRMKVIVRVQDAALILSKSDFCNP